MPIDEAWLVGRFGVLVTMTIGFPDRHSDEIPTHLLIDWEWGGVSIAC